MKLLEELRSLDVNDPGRWPPRFRAAAAVSTFLAVFFLGARVFVNAELEWLRQTELEEGELRAAFEQTQRKAANLGGYRTQVAEIERSFGAMLHQLPGETEVPGLLADISQAGLGAGLEEQLFQPLEEVHKEFYAELPIEIRLKGDYHRFAEFVSGIAALPRIATLHDIHIRPADPGEPEDLLLDITAKTYRYLEEGAGEP